MLKMISNISDNYLLDFNRIGVQVNSNFEKLFDLNTINEDDNCELFGYFDSEKLVGFIHITKLVDELEIINIVVDDAYRRMGIGSKLIEFILNMFKEYKAIFLDVNVNNSSAIKLYKKYNFSVVNTRKHYYGNDDCYVMRKEM